jgi:hypothetical protein
MKQPPGLHVAEHMKKLAISILALWIPVRAMAFDPAGPPPTKTVEWTLSHISKVTIPRIDIDDTATVEGCISFLNLASGAPKEYRVEIDGSALGKEKLEARSTIKLKARDIKLIEVLGKIADSVQASLVIEAGKVHLVPKEAAVTGPFATHPQSDSKASAKPQLESEGHSR